MERKPCTNCGRMFYPKDETWFLCIACWAVTHPGSPRSIGQHFVSRPGFNRGDLRVGKNGGGRSWSLKFAAHAEEQSYMARAAAAAFEAARDARRDAKRRSMRLMMLKKVHAARKVGKVRGYMDFSKHDAELKARGHNADA